MYLKLSLTVFEEHPEYLNNRIGRAPKLIDSSHAVDIHIAKCMAEFSQVVHMNVPPLLEHSYGHRISLISQPINLADKEVGWRDLPDHEVRCNSRAHEWVDF